MARATVTVVKLMCPRKGKQCVLVQFIAISLLPGRRLGQHSPQTVCSNCWIRDCSKHWCDFAAPRDLSLNDAVLL